MVVLVQDLEDDMDIFNITVCRQLAENKVTVLIL